MNKSPNIPSRKLEAIYLDTCCLTKTTDLPSKVSFFLIILCLYMMIECAVQAEATAGLIQLMAMFPFNTKFFINTWTWGYEEILCAISRAFGNQVC